MYLLYKNSEGGDIMTIRKIIEIDEEKCNGCGECLINCAEGALEIIDGKAKLVADVYCDGLGACLGECPTGALEVVEREAVEFDEDEVETRLAELKTQEPQTQEPQLQVLPQETSACGCSSSTVQELTPIAKVVPPTESTVGSALSNWPLQLQLVPTEAAFYENADLLIAADCTGFALTDLHQTFLPGSPLIIACPKLDETSSYEEKLAKIFASNSIKSINLLFMTVPCCNGLLHLVKQALKKSGKSIPLTSHKIHFTGDVVEENNESVAV
jgi:ferredoxin